MLEARLLRMTEAFICWFPNYAVFLLSVSITFVTFLSFLYGISVVNYRVEKRQP